MDEKPCRHDRSRRTFANDHAPRDCALINFYVITDMTAEAGLPGVVRVDRAPGLLRRAADGGPCGHAVRAAGRGAGVQGMRAAQLDCREPREAMSQRWDGKCDVTCHLLRMVLACAAAAGAGPLHARAAGQLASIPALDDEGIVSSPQWLSECIQ